MTDTRLLPVVAAVLADADGCVLLQRRPPGKPHAGLWEFPGGKIDAGELPEAALVRELAEELGIAADPAGLEPVTFASVAGEGHHLVLLLYRVRRWTGTPRARAADALAWVPPHDMAALPMPPGDVPLVAVLRRLFPPRRHGTGNAKD